VFATTLPTQVQHFCVKIRNCRTTPTHQSVVTRNFRNTTDAGLTFIV